MIQSVEYWEGLQSPKYSGEELWNSGRFLFVCLIGHPCQMEGFQKGQLNLVYQAMATGLVSQLGLQLLSSVCFQQAYSSSQLLLIKIISKHANSVLQLDNDNNAEQGIPRLPDI